MKSLLRYEPIYITGIILLAYLIGALFQPNQDAVMLVALVPGIAVGLFFIEKNHLLIPVLVGTLLGSLLKNFFFFDSYSWQTFYLTAVEVLAIYITSIATIVVVKKYHIRFDGLHSMKQIPLFLIVVSGLMILNNVLMLLEVVVVTPVVSIGHRFWIRGLSISVLAGIFGSTIVNSHYHDLKPVRDYSVKEILYRIGFFVGFTSITYLVFQEDVMLASYKEMLIVLTMLYFITAFHMSVRMLFINNVVVLIMFYQFYLPGVAPVDEPTQILVLLFYMLSMTAISALTRIIYSQRIQTIDQLHQAQKSMEQMIVSTNNLLKVQDKLPHYKDKFSRDYMRDMFEIACKLYPGFDQATCYVKGEDAVEFLDAVGYDLTYLNRLKFNPDVFEWSLYKPIIVYETNNENAFPMEGDLEEFTKTYKVIRESVRFTVYIGENYYGGMSFDIVEGSNRHFTEIDLSHFTTFQNLMNSYYGLGKMRSIEDEMKDSIILTTLESLNLIDNYTGYHSQEVAELASELGQKLHLKDEDIKTLYWAGIVHDIGKLGVTSELLNKPDKLSSSEMDIVRMHPTFAFKLLRQSPTLEPLSTIVLHHHENWDGTGYPNKLKAMAIPYLSQILHVADAVCAMGRQRKFKDAMTIPEIRHELEEKFATQFSPKVTRTMIQYIDDGELEVLWKHNRK